jgi:hypothetical protein
MITKLLDKGILYKNSILKIYNYLELLHLWLPLWYNASLEWDSASQRQVLRRIYGNHQRRKKQ